ncbi:MAG: histidine phosphatase family protein [Candidatus Kerfeldbacteria bacterium]|nr:histidine phosphatase family protein [Candidatus Kerfeldbacteria bacterium]
MSDPEFFFIRHGQLVPPYLDHLKMDYQTLVELSTGVLDPGINQNASELFSRQAAEVDFSSVRHVYYNSSGISSRRSLESARCIIANLRQLSGGAITLRGLPEIREVRFDVSGLLSEYEFSQRGMAAIRAALYLAAFQGGAAEPTAEIAKRIGVLHKVVEEHASKGESVLFVTHDFFMRFLEVYITRAERLKEVHITDLDNTSLNYYFGGFRSDGLLWTLMRWGDPVNH